MDNSDSPPIYLVLSVVITGILHVLLWQLSMHWTVTPFGHLSDDLNRPQRNLTVESINLEEQVEPPKVPEKANIQDRLLEEQRKHLTTIFDQQRNPDLPKIQPRTAIAALNPAERQREAIRPPGGMLSSPPPKIIAIDADQVPLERLLSKRRTIPRVKRYDLRGPRVPSMTSGTPGPLGTGAASMYKVNLGARLPAPPRIKPPLPTPKPNLALIQERTPAVELESYEDTHILDSMLDATFAAHTDPGTAEIYYSFSIRPNEQSDEVPPIPRDILFLLDASASISDEELNEYKAGIQLALDYLQPDDAFNIVVFRADARALFSSFVAPTPENILKARKYVKGQSTLGKTDIYTSLAPYVNRSRVSKRPYMIFLITDGKSTTGSKLENDDMIRRILGENTANASIFSFSAGSKDTNRFLLNFLSYKNRGLSLHEERLSETHRTFVRYFGSLAEVLVADLNYDISGALAHDAFPRELHHLFRSQPLVVYGRAKAGQDIIDLRVVGRNRDGGREELILRKRLSEAQPGGQSLALRWAAQKIYHLIAERSMGNNPNADAEIAALTKKYNIAVPY